MTSPRQPQMNQFNRVVIKQRLMHGNNENNIHLVLHPFKLTTAILHMNRHDSDLKDPWNNDDSCNT